MAILKTVIHQDAMKLDVSRRKMKKTDEGFYAGSAPIAKVGIMSYLMADGSIVREFVPKETLFNRDSMASLCLKPVTNRHPQEKKVTVDNASFRQVGFVGEKIEVDTEEDYLCANMVITDADTISCIDSGRQELSPGYEAELDFTPGEYKGERYDAIQTRRKYNHVAVVDNARGGSDIRMHCDGFESKLEINNLNQEKKMSVKFKIDGIEYDTTPEVINFINKQDALLVTEKAAVKTANDSLQAMTAERDTLKVKVDELERRDIKKEVNDAVQARLELERVANVILDSVDENIDNRSLKVAIINKKIPSIKIDEKTTDVYINAVLDTVIATMSKDETDNLSAQRKVVAGGTKQDGSNNNDSEDVVARKKMIENQQNAHKQK